MNVSSSNKNDKINVSIKQNFSRILLSKTFPVDHIHLVGIGGIGMGGVAEILLKKGYRISGSDLFSNRITRKLERLGAKIYLNHSYRNINEYIDLVIVSKAISKNNPEIVAAKKLCLPIIGRLEILMELTRFQHSVAVTGTHGKTTTTAMLINIYDEAKLYPTFINGGFLKNIKTNARLGSDKFFVIEIDESDKSFFHFRPTLSIVTNIESDHLEFYHGNFEKLKHAFSRFIENVPFYGFSIICIDDPEIRAIHSKTNSKTITYGFSEYSDLCIKDYHQNFMNSKFTLFRKGKKNLRVQLNVPGRHNALNATAAIALATEIGIDDSIVLEGIKKFTGVERRFEHLGNYDLFPICKKTGKITIIDDYGHHPTELSITIDTIRSGWIGRRIIMIFQPHRYTRTRDLYYDFVNVLSKVDVLLLFDIYPAWEKHISDISSHDLFNSIRKQNQVNPFLISSINDFQSVLVSILENNDLLLIQGAGTIRKIVKNLISL